jgi:hypothetical protein
MNFNEDDAVELDKELKAEKRAKAEVPLSSDGALDEVAAMSRMEYEQKRESIAERLGIRVSALDAIRSELQKEAKTVGRTIERAHWEVEPWHEKVNGKALVTAIAIRIRRPST